MQQAVATRTAGCAVPASRIHHHGTARTRSVVVRAAAATAQDKFIPPWRDVYNELKTKGLRTISPEEAADLLKTGQLYLLVDCDCR